MEEPRAQMTTSWQPMPSSPTKFAQSLCCPCITYAQTKRKLNQTPESLIPDAMLYGCTLPCWCCGIHALIGSSLRKDIRHKYHIEGGNPVTDCLGHWYCAPCLLTQEYNQVEVTENKTFF